jgi:hypothetical protein
MERVMARPEFSDASRELMELVIDGRVGSYIREPAKLLTLKYLAQQSGLPTLARFIQEGRILEVASLVAQIQSGDFVLRGLADVGRLIDAFRLVDETWRAGNQFLGWIGGRIKAPQIIVPAGFPVEALVVESPAG